MPPSQDTTYRPLGLAVVYARVSSEDQARGYSIAVQIDACRTVAAEHG
jgi:DNA invertase Pin-like site-specific DNA recombinase